MDFHFGGRKGIAEQQIGGCSKLTRKKALRSAISLVRPEEHPCSTRGFSSTPKVPQLSRARLGGLQPLALPSQEEEHERGHKHLRPST